MSAREEATGGRGRFGGPMPATFAFHRRVWVLAGAGIALSTAIAWTSYEIFEERFLDLRRCWPSSTGAAAARTS